MTDTGYIFMKQAKLKYEKKTAPPPFVSPASGVVVLFSPLVLCFELSCVMLCCLLSLSSSLLFSLVLCYVVVFRLLSRVIRDKKRRTTKELKTTKVDRREAKTR
jgi:hypothetical protein